MTSPSSGNNWQERNSNSQNKELFGWKKKKCLFITHYSSFHNSVSYNSIFPKYFQNPVWHLKLSFVFNFKNSKTWNPPSDHATIVPQVYLLFYSFFLINKKKIDSFFLPMYSSLRVATVQVKVFFFWLCWGFCESLEGCYGGHSRNRTSSLAPNYKKPSLCKLQNIKPIHHSKSGHSHHQHLQHHIKLHYKA